MPYYNIVDGHCFVISDENLTTSELYKSKSTIEKDINFQILANEIKEAGLTINVKVDQEFGWLVIYFGHMINNDNHSYQGKVITFKKEPFESADANEKMRTYDQRIETILNYHQLPHYKDIGIIYNQWD